MIKRFLRKENRLLTWITLLFLIIGLLEPTKSRSETVNDSNTTEPNCYYQNARGFKLNLDSLCGNSQHKSSTFNLNSQEVSEKSPLTIKNVKLIIDSRGNDRKVFIEGNITNNSNVVQKYIEVLFEVDTLREGDLKKAESQKVFADEQYLESGETTTFKSQIKTSFDLLQISSLDSVESHSIPINICYASTVERRELCKRVNPRYIEELKISYIRK
jgi:hypothetical protein